MYDKYKWNAVRHGPCALLGVWNELISLTKAPFALDYSHHHCHIRFNIDIFYSAKHISGHDPVLHRHGRLELPAVG